MSFDTPSFWLFAAAVLAPPAPTLNFAVNSSITSGSDTNVIDTGASSGTITVNVNFFGRPDNIRIYYEGNLILDATNTQTATYTVAYAGLSTVVTIIIDEGSLAGRRNFWDYTASIQPNLGAQPDIVVIGGAFTHYNGAMAQHIAKLLDDGTADATFGATVGPNTVQALGIHSDPTVSALVGKVLVGGNFSRVHGVEIGRAHV